MTPGHRRFGKLAQELPDTPVAHRLLPWTAIRTLKDAKRKLQDDRRQGLPRAAEERTQSGRLRVGDFFFKAAFSALSCCTIVCQSKLCSFQALSPIASPPCFTTITQCLGIQRDAPNARYSSDLRARCKTRRQTPHFCSAVTEKLCLQGLLCWKGWESLRMGS